MNNDIIELIQERYGIIGKSKVIKESVELLRQAAPTDLSVLITGETGTGKEVFANAIHGLSDRKNKPYVSVNCGAIPESLLESELFGHEKGAFTGATDKRTGFFESADNGTIFLDEIGEMPIGTQVKLLRILESGEFSRLGSSAVRKVDVRVIAATNRELEQNVENKTFRQDLYFRLKNVHIELPSLRERLEDIEPLVQHFGANVAEKNGFEFHGISEDGLSLLKSLPWKGNIRELRNMIETIVTLEKVTYLSSSILNNYIPRALPAHEYKDSEPKESLVSYSNNDSQGNNYELGLIFRSLVEIKHEITDLKYGIKKVIEEMDYLKEDIHKPTPNPEPEELTFEEFFDSMEEKRIDEVEKKMISLTLDRFEGNRRLAAKSLGISERTLYRKINDYDLNR